MFDGFVFLSVLYVRSFLTIVAVNNVISLCDNILMLKMMFLKTDFVDLRLTFITITEVPNV